MLYTYWDHSTLEKKIVFQCIAENILEADKLYEKATGKDVTKQSYIGCEIGCEPQTEKAEK